jgi:hypothetical protein
MNPPRRGRGVRAACLAGCIAAALGGTAVHAADAPPEQPIRAARLLPGEKIELDGTLSNPAWQRAPVFEPTYEIEPVRGREPQYRTRVQVLYDDQALYVGVTALDPQPQAIRAPLVRHDQVKRTQDFVVLYIDPIGARKAAQFFRVGASGSTGDGLHTASNDNEDFSPDFDFDSAVARNDQGYTVVFRVPYSSLRYTSGPQQRWRIMVGRRIPRENVMLTLTVPLPQEALSFIDLMQPLEGFEPPVRNAFLQVRPTVTLRRTEERPFGAPRSREDEAKLSADLKWRPLPELVADATLNPDFSQVALDTPQLSRNTRFALFLTEKRPFFLESTDLLVSPTDALYTRSINDPRWGLRATWRGDRLAGTALALRDKGGGVTQIPGAYGTGYALQPANDALMSRAQWHLGTLTLGGLAGARRYEADDGSHAGDNAVGGLDAQWFASEHLRLKAQALLSHTTALDTERPDGSHVLREGAARRGGLGYLGLYWRTNRSETELSLLEASDGFRNDVGFVSQAGIRKLMARQTLTWFELGPFNLFQPFLNFERVEERDGGRAVSQKWVPGFWFTSAGNTELTLELYPDEKSRVQADGPLHSARYAHLWTQTTPALWMPLIEAWADVGRLVDVSAQETAPGHPVGRVVPGHRWGFDLQTRPLARLELQPRVEVLTLRNPEEGRYREVAAQLLAIGHIDARQTLRVILQRSSFQREGSGKDAQTAQSLTYTWRHSAGTVLYVGATRGTVGLPLAPSRSTELFAKLQFDLNEMARWW